MLALIGYWDMAQMIQWKGWCDMEKNHWQFNEILVVIVIILLICGNIYSWSRSSRKTAYEEAYKEGFIAGYDSGYNDGIEGEEYNHKGEF